MRGQHLLLQGDHFVAPGLSRGPMINSSPHRKMNNGIIGDLLKARFIFMWPWSSSGWCWCPPSQSLLTPSPSWSTPMLWASSWAMIRAPLPRLRASDIVHDAWVSDWLRGPVLRAVWEFCTCTGILSICVCVCTCICVCICICIFHLGAAHAWEISHATAASVTSWTDQN